MSNATAPAAIPAIRPPRNPFWEVFRTFGRDELTGGVIALVATALIEGSFHLYNNGGLWGVELAAFTAVQIWVLALAGPVLEKVGFFFWHVKEARDTYHNTPVIYRKPLGFYIRNALRGGSKTLMWDILLHDPMYIGLMLLGMHIHPATPAWLLVPVAFGLAVVAVAFLEVGIGELRYVIFRDRVSRYPRSFKLERYYDARFYLDPSADPEEVIEILRNRFLPNHPVVIRNYEDHYYHQTTPPDFNGREAVIRVRDREAEPEPSRWDNEEPRPQKMISVQYIFSRVIEGAQELNQFRCFPRQKDKIYHVSHDLLAAKRVASDEIKKTCTVGVKPAQSIAIRFERRMVYDPNIMLLAVDRLYEEGKPNGHTVIEVKVYPEKLELLIEAMHFIMHQFPALQTTDPKLALIDGQGSAA
tara:strand:+ start:489 stop:1733 length:1245 start_codon:yes stop_codon:yes gene_type:complete